MPSPSTALPQLTVPRTGRRVPGPRSGNSGALAGVRVADVIDRLLADETMSAIAKSLQVSRSGLNQLLLREAESEWRTVQIARALSAMELAKERLEAAGGDALSVARARERLRAAQWELERLWSRVYGARQEVTVSTAPILHIHLGADVGAAQHVALLQRDPACLDSDSDA